jgi:hypothetical protein
LLSASKLYFISTLGGGGTPRGGTGRTKGPEMDAVGRAAAAVQLSQNGMRRRFFPREITHEAQTLLSCILLLLDSGCLGCSGCLGLLLSFQYCGVTWLTSPLMRGSKKRKNGD